MKIINRYLSGFVQLITLICGYIPSHHVRRLIYRFFLRMNIQNSTIIYGGAEIRSPKKISIGAHSVIGHYAILDGRFGIKIGENVNLSTGVWIWTSEHDLQHPYFKAGGSSVTIEDYAWISSRVVILPGVKIGHGAVVASGSVVTKDVDPYNIVAGVPAKVIGMRSTELNYTLGKNYKPFF